MFNFQLPCLTTPEGRCVPGIAAVFHGKNCYAAVQAPLEEDQPVGKAQHAEPW